MEELHCRKERKVNDYSVWGSFVMKFGVLELRSSEIRFLGTTEAKHHLE